MPAIPQYVAGNTPQGSRGISAVDTGGQSIARGISSLAGGLQDVAQGQFAILDANQRKKQRDALVAADTAFATFQVQQENRLRQRQLEAPLDVTDFTAVTHKEYDDGLAELRKGINDPTAHQLIAGRAQVFREKLSGDSTLFEATQGIKSRTAKVVTAREQREILVRSAPGQYGEVKAQHLAVLESAGLPPDVLRQQTEESTERLAMASVATQVEADPYQALKALKAGPGESGNQAIEDLSPDGRERARNAAEVEIRQRESEARARAAEAKMIAAAQASALKDYMADAQQQFAMGFGLPEGYAAARAGIQQLPDTDPRKADLLRQESVLSTLDNSGFMALSPDKQEQAVTGLEAEMQSVGATPGSIDMLRIARSVQAETDRLAKDDPVRFAIGRKVIQPPQETGDPLADLKSRAVIGRQVSEYLGRDVPGFTNQELSTLGGRYAKGSVDESLNIVAAITQTHGQAQASTVFAALDKQGQTGMGLVGALTTDDLEAARLVVKGQKALKEGGKEAQLLAPKKDGGLVLTDLLGDAYGLGTSARATVENGVWSAYAALSQDDGDASGEFDDDRLEKAVEAVTGGLVTYAGKTMPTPKRGVTQSQFSGWADSLQATDFAGVVGLEPERALQVFKRDGWLEAVGPNQYAPVILGPDGRGRFMIDAKGNPVTVSYDGGLAKTVSERVSEAFSTTPFGPVK